MSLNEAIDFILTVIHYKLLGVRSATSSVMMVMSFTWIFEFVWICSVVLTDVLHKIILITVGFCMIGIRKLSSIHCKHWVYFMDVFSGYATPAQLVEKWWCLKTSYFTLFQESFLLSCTNWLRPSEAIWQQELWQHWPIWWDVTRRHQATTWTNGDLNQHLCVSPMGNINRSSVMQSLLCIWLFWILFLVTIR